MEQTVYYVVLIKVRLYDVLTWHLTIHGRNGRHDV